MQVRTHERIDPTLCGRVTTVGEGTATVSFETTVAMSVDERGLVHGGFVFGLADHAAMVAVNDPHVVLGASEVRFLAPVRVGDIVEATATRTSIDRRKHLVEVTASVGDTEVLRGSFTTFVLDKHVLD